MSFSKEYLSSFNSLFHIIKLRNYTCKSSHEDAIKSEQIIAYLELIDSEAKKLSKNKCLVFVESAAGNCYLSFLLYYYYSVILNRPIEVHCIDTNERLMDNCRDIANKLAFANIFFHSMDIDVFCIKKDIDFAYSLHACDIATDKALYLGVRGKARFIFSVCCCQETANRKFKTSAIHGVARYKSLKEKLVYIIVDTMRAQLIEKCGYKVDIFDFVSSRVTNKNIMLRARRDNNRKDKFNEEEYAQLKTGFNIEPKLASYLR